MSTRILDIALDYRRAGLSPIAVRSDGSKAPAFSGWRDFAKRHANDAELQHWFGNGTVHGIGIACGPASGNLVVLDVETGAAWEAWRSSIPADTTGYLDACPVVKTPRGGAHVWVRLPEAVPGTVLARHADKGVMIEVRGEGHQVLAPGCPPQCHPSGKLYEFIGRGWLDVDTSPVPLDVWFSWLDTAASLTEYTPPKPTAPATPRPERDPNVKSPGDDFNARGSWEETGLFAAGWSWERQLDGDRGFVRRPGKKDSNSGTVGMIVSKSGSPLFYCFTSNGHPFEHEASYDRFGVFARLKHGSDFRLAAKALLEMGYGERTASTRPASKSAEHRVPPSRPIAAPPVAPTPPTPPAAIQEPEPAAPFNDTDVANGRAFAAEHSAAVRFVVDWKTWVVFDVNRWVVDKGETRVESLAKLTTDRMAWDAATKVSAASKALASAVTDGEKDVANRALKAANHELQHAKKTQDMRNLRRMLGAARSEPGIVVPLGREVFDTHTNLLNCPNGTVDLKTGKLGPHRREDFITRLCPTKYIPGATCCEYLAFLSKVFDRKAEVAVYIRALSGYIATGETCDHSFHVFYGDGSNGKSVLLTLWTAVLGQDEYQHSAAAELLVNDGRDRHPTEKVGLRGARLVTCVESKEGGKLDEPKVKALTSSDMISARGMGQDFFAFKPTHKLILATNHKPRLSGTDHGIRRRIRLVPFAVQFWKEADREQHPERKYDEEFRADPGLEDRLKATETEGILADMVQHAVEFYRTKSLTPPAEVCAATSEYLDAEDIIGQFFQATTVADPDGRLKAKEFHEKFKKWAVGEGHDENRLPGVRKFGIEAQRRFVWKKSGGVVYLVSVYDIPV